MRIPALAENETLRIDTLRSLKILDTQPEERFDRLTRLAKRLFGVPIALVSLVDADRQWFKSCVGLSASETARDISFCGHAILQDEILLVADASVDERFCDNPLVIDDPKIRFYAGYPLTVPNGSKLGTLCLIDREPRDFSDEDRQLLYDLGRMAEQELAALQLATMDELTLLSNRRGFEALAQHGLNLCKRQNHCATLLFFDLDSLKAINDRYGHAEGDRALSGFSRLLKDSFRESDVVGRFGGDEFAVFLSNVDQTGSQMSLRRFEQVLNEYNRSADRGYDIRYSVGAVEYDSDRHPTLDKLLRAADTLMYRQKKAKREPNENYSTYPQNAICN